MCSRPFPDLTHGDGSGGGRTAKISRRSRLVTRRETPPPHARLLDTSFTALVLNRALYAAAKLGIADFLRDGPKSSDDLAKATNAHPGALYRLLRALASGGVLSESKDRRFALTRIGSLLRSDAQGSMRGWVTFSGEPFYLQAWQEILYTIRTGKPAWEKVHGMPVFDYFARHPDVAAIFDAAMTSLSGWEAPAIVEAYDFSRFHTLVDVGGGHGRLLLTILKANPKLRGILYDQPHVVEGAHETIGAEGLTRRCEVVEGSFFESVPAGSDGYILKYIIHDWDDEHSIKILRNCRRAMNLGAKLLLVETIIPGPEKPDIAKIADLEMLVLLGSRERTKEEYGTLLREAGLRLTRIVPTREALGIIEAVRK